MKASRQHAKRKTTDQTIKALRAELVVYKAWAAQQTQKESDAPSVKFLEREVAQLQAELGMLRQAHGDLYRFVHSKGANT